MSTTVREWFTRRARYYVVALSGAMVLCPMVCAQAAGLEAPVIAAHVKGPDQINLTWGAVTDPGYGYLVEGPQSTGDSRYTTWTELEPIPRRRLYVRQQHCGARSAL